jgi:hypothetical protein
MNGALQVGEAKQWASASPPPPSTRTAVSLTTLADHGLQFELAAVRVVEYSDSVSTNPNRLDLVSNPGTLMKAKK